MDTEATRHSPVTFTTDVLEPANRFDAYRDYTRSINDISIPREAREGFNASTTNWVLGRVMIGVVRTPEMALSRSMQLVRQDDLDHWVLRVSRSGNVVSRATERSYRSGPGDLVLESLAAPYEDKWTAGEWVSVAFPRDMLPGLCHRNLHDCIGPLDHAPARVLSGFLLSLAEQLPRARAADTPRLTEALRGMILATLDESTPQPVSASHLRVHVDRIIREQIASARLGPARIAELAGISRSALYRLFEAEGGVAAHVRRLRLERVRADLLDPSKRREPIARIAERWGFYCTTGFNRSFKAAFDMTPGDMRDGSSREASAPSRPRAAGSRTDLAGLVLVR